MGRCAEMAAAQVRPGAGGAPDSDPAAHHAGHRDATAAPRITGPVRVHCGFHKCLTMYSRRIYRRACFYTLRAPRGFRHFFHFADDFYARCADYRVTSISGHAIDLDRFDDIRVVRLVRDPRDLLVSGYHYHLRGTEDWMHVTDPRPADWARVDGVIPPGMRPGESMLDFLARLSPDEALRAQLVFRRNHFDSMRRWPREDARVLLLRYEDILGGEEAVFERIFDHLELNGVARRRGRLYARRHAAHRRAARRDHIRNPRSGQWRDHLPADVAAAVARDYGDVLDRYGYPER